MSLLIGTRVNLCYDSCQAALPTCRAGESQSLLWPKSHRSSLPTSPLIPAPFVTLFHKKKRNRLTLFLYSTHTLSLSTRSLCSAYNYIAYFYILNIVRFGFRYYFHPFNCLPHCNLRPNMPKLNSPGPCTETGFVCSCSRSILAASFL